MHQGADLPVVQCYEYNFVWNIFKDSIFYDFMYYMLGIISSGHARHPY